MPLTTQSLAKLRRIKLPPTGNKVDLAFTLADAKAMDLVRATGLRAQYVSDVRAGRIANLTVPNARKFAAFFGCSIDDLFPPRTREALVM